MLHGSIERYRHLITVPFPRVQLQLNHSAEILMDKKGHHGVLLMDWQPHGIIAIFHAVQVYTVYSKCGIQCRTLQINYSCKKTPIWWSVLVTTLSDEMRYWFATAQCLFSRIDLIFDIWCFNATFNNISAISWRPVLVVEEAGVSGENHRPWASNW